MTKPTRDEVVKLLAIHIRITDDSEEWEGPCPRITGINKAADALMPLIEQGARTPGTVEVCEKCRAQNYVGCGRTLKDICQREDCHIRTAAQTGTQG